MSEGSASATSQPAAAQTRAVYDELRRLLWPLLARLAHPLDLRLVRTRRIGVEARSRSAESKRCGGGAIAGKGCG